MGTRVLGKRLNNYHEPRSHHNISVNMYPVNSAIAVRDLGDNPSEQLTIMVDRTMAGTAGLVKGRIELLHARRLLYDDDDALEIVLNETYDAPLTIYTMQMFDRRFEEPLQRKQQAFTDAQPIAEQIVNKYA